MQVEKIKGVYDCWTYVIQAGEGVILFDSSAEFESVKGVIGGKPIFAVLLTHGHFDHIYNAKEYQDRGIKLYIHRADQDCLYSDNNLAKYTGRSIADCKADVIVADGQELTFGDTKIRVMHTPGHTKGGVCYCVKDSVFSGDTLFYHDYGRTDLIGGSEQELTASVRKLLKQLDPKTVVYPGHGRSTTIQEEREFFESTIGTI